MQQKTSSYSILLFKGTYYVLQQSRKYTTFQLFSIFSHVMQFLNITINNTLKPNGRFKQLIWFKALQ